MIWKLAHARDFWMPLCTQDLKFSWNRPIHFKAQGMWGTCGVLPGYILSMYHAHFPYISMEIMLNFDPHARCLEVGYTDNMNISQKLAFSSTRGKLSRLPKVILHGATGHQRQQCLMHLFQVFLQRPRKIAVFCYGYQTRSMAEAQRSPLHVCYFDIWTCIVSFLAIPHTYNFQKIISTNMFGNTILPLVW